MTFWDFCNAHPWISLTALFLIVSAMPRIQFSAKWRSNKSDSESEAAK